MNESYEKQLEAWAETALKQLPPRTAPATLIPGVMLAITEREARPWWRKSWLVVEVMSPSSRKTDLFAKPGEYAEAGIPLFWRLDLDPEPLLHAFALADGRYAEVATVRGEGVVPVPWGALTIDLGPIPER